MRRHALLDTDQWGRNQQALLGLLCLALLAVLSVVGLKAAFGAYDGGYDLTARFEGAGQNLDTESVVKLRGVDVGRVESIDLDDRSRAVVRLRIEPDVEVPRSAVAVIRPISVFGPKFVDLIPGPGEGDGPFLADGDEIERTRPALELTDILGDASELLDAVDPEDVTTVLHTFAEGVDGLDAELAASITNGQTVLSAMVDSSADRHVLFESLAGLADELADEGDTLLAIGANSRRSLPTLTEREEELSELLESTSRLSGDLADVVRANGDVLGPGIEGGAALSDITADDLGGVVAYLDFVNTYGSVLSQVIRVPVAGTGFLAATQQFLLSSNPCEALVQIQGCGLPAIDPGPGAAGRPGSPP